MRRSKFGSITNDRDTILEGREGRRREVASEGTPARHAHPPTSTTKARGGIGPRGPARPGDPPLKTAHGGPEAVVKRHRACELLFLVGVVREWNVCRAPAFTMSVPAFIDISEEDQVCPWATGAARAGLGKLLRV